MDVRVDALDMAIINEVRRVTCPRTGAFERVHPHDVVVWLPVQVSMRTVRRRMAKLASAGYLVRLGERRGFTVMDGYGGRRYERSA